MKSSKTTTKGSTGGPDQGWAWVVAIACFIINFIMAGLARTAGVLYVALIDLYGISRESATTPFSIRVCVRNMTGPVIGLLGQRYGIRLVTSIGALFAAVGGMLCCFAPNVLWITVFWGVIHGLGFGLSTVLHMMVIHQYFDKYKATALGLGYSGDCVGTFAFPVLLEVLIETYGVKGTFLILGGIIFNVLPMALLLKTPPWLEKTTALKNQTPKKEHNGKLSVQPEGPPPSEIAFHQWKVIKYYPYNVSDICRGLPVQLVHLSERTHSFNSPIAEHDNSNCFKVVDAEQGIAFRHNADDNFRGNQNGNVLESHQETAAAYRMYVVESHHTVTRQDDIPLGVSYINNGFVPSTLSVHQAGVIDIKDHLRDKNIAEAVQEMKNCRSHSGSVSSCMSSIPPKATTQSDNSEVSSVLVTVGNVVANPMFNLISMTLAVYAFLFVTVATIIIDYGVDKGISQQEGKYLIIGFSAADLVGRLSFGSIIDKKLVSLHCYLAITVTLMAGLVASIPWCPDFTALMAVMVSYGLIQGGTAIVFPILIGNYMKKHEENIAMGAMNFYGGLIMLGMAPMIGFFRDQYGSYDGIFYITGGITAFIGCVWLLEPFIMACQNKSSEQKKTVVSSSGKI